MSKGQDQERGRRPLAVITFLLAAIGLLADLIDIASGYHQALAQVSGWWQSLAQDAGSSLLQPHLWPMQLVFFVAMCTITYYEWRQNIIPDAVTIPGIVIGLGMTAGFGHVTPLSAILGAALGFGLLAILNLGWHRLTGQYGLGWGVPKMAAMIGAFLGWQGTLATLLVASLVGGLYALIRFPPWRGRWSPGATFEYGPVLAFSGLVCAIVPLGRFLAGG